MEDGIAENRDVVNQLPDEGAVVVASGDAIIGNQNDDANSARLGTACWIAGAKEAERDGTPDNKPRESAI